MNTLDLFCGAGGLSLGSELSGNRTLAGVDIDESAISTFRHNLPAVGITTNLTEREPSTLPVSKEQVDMIIGGPPCQDFSVANRFSRGGEKTNLVFVYASYVEHFEPDVFVMENVVGIRTTDDVFDRLCENFRELGYDVTDKTLSADDFGVPQKRKRVFVVGTKNGVSFEWPDSTTETKTVEDAFAGLPDIKSGEKDDSFSNHRAPNHQQKTIDRIADRDWGEALYDSWTEKIRLDPRKPAPTLKAGQRANYHFGHPYADRG